MIQNPFNTKIEDVPENVEEKVIELLNDIDFKSKRESSKNLKDFWCIFKINIT